MKSGRKYAPLCFRDQGMGSGSCWQQGLYSPPQDLMGISTVGSAWAGVGVHGAGAVRENGPPGQQGFHPNLFNPTASPASPTVSPDVFLFV